MPEVRRTEPHLDLDGGLSEGNGLWGFSLGRSSGLQRDDYLPHVFGETPGTMQ